MAAPTLSRTLLLRLPIGRWQDQAACTTGDAWLFHSTTDGAAEGDRETSDFRRLRVAAAKRICRACPVRAACLESALAEGDRWAIRGGTTPQERGFDSQGRKRAKQAPAVRQAATKATTASRRSAA